MKNYALRWCETHTQCVSLTPPRGLLKLSLLHSIVSHIISIPTLHLKTFEQLFWTTLDGKIYSGFIRTLGLFWFFFAQQAKRAEPTQKHQGVIYCNFTNNLLQFFIL